VKEIPLSRNPVVEQYQVKFPISLKTVKKHFSRSSDFGRFYQHVGQSKVEKSPKNAYQFSSFETLTPTDAASKPAQAERATSENHTLVGWLNYRQTFIVAVPSLLRWMASLRATCKRK
jgi:hypothetical protein